MTTPNTQDPNTQDPNDRFLIADFTVDGSRKQIYLLNPSDHFHRFGGSSRGLTARFTASLIVREWKYGGCYDTEYPINAKQVWDRIFNVAHLAEYDPLADHSGDNNGG